jgi:O-antigen biosynthesis protein WbqV
MLRGLKIAIHIALPLAAYLSAYAFVLSPGLGWWLTPAAGQVWWLATIYALLAAVLEIVFRTERSSWRYVSVQDALALVRSTFITMAAFLLIVFVLMRATDVPRSVLLIAWVLHLGGLMSIRLFRRALYERSLVRAIAPLFHRQPTGRTKLLVVGEIGAADAFLRELARDAEPQYEAVAVLTLSASDRGGLVRGVAVNGTVDDLKDTVEAFNAGRRPLEAVLFLSPPDIVRDLSAETVGHLKAHGVSLLRLPAITEVSASRASLPSALRELSVEELLARQPIQLDLSRIHDLINGKRVLVTGAGGSIGSEICRQVAAFGCSRLTMLDHSEFALFSIGREIAVSHPALERRERLCDVRDAVRVLGCVKAEAPDLIFHAAALKHVTLVENQPAEGLLTNVVGTANVVRAAEACAVGHMVMISTDKAVDPSCMMGATKRLAEAVVRSHHGASGTGFSVVRFGNVLGSTGSVVPIFRDQIARGGPVTVTDPEVERYFMTIPEAVQLVLHATAESADRSNAHPGLFVLDMGAPVKILDLARKMIMLQGLSVGADIEIVFTGLKPGEKVSEALIDSNERVSSHLASVFEVVDNGVGDPLSAFQIKELEALARTGDDRAIENAVYEHIDRLRGVEQRRAAG